MKIDRQQKGFTLVEIMIVVAIIGLLAAIAIPNLLRARINANDKAIQGDLRAFSTANESYRGAQNPPTYAAGFADLTPPRANPAYLDSTWTNGATKHGHTIAYTVDVTTGGAYSLVATARANEAAVQNCIDQSGVLQCSNAATAPAAGGTGCGTGWTPCV